MKAREMKRIIYLFLILLIFCFCSSKQEKVERIMEDGVEVVINHLKPFKNKDEPATFTLEKEVIIDTEQDKLAELGITSMRNFDVDSEGNIFIYNESRILQFNKAGNHIKTIGQKGQGPGEMGFCSSLTILNSGEISTYDLMNRKFLIFHKDGSLKEEIKDTSIVSVLEAVYLDNGNYLFNEKEINPKTRSISAHLSLFDKDFTKIKDLDGNVIKENPVQAARFNIFDYYIHYQFFNNRIYVANSQTEDLEMEVYDLEGRLVKKIRKISRKVRIPDEYKQEQIEVIKKGRMWDTVKDKAYFPENFPPFKTFYIDDIGRILVEAYENGEAADQYVFDIFNPEGIFIGRKSLKGSVSRMFKNKRLYCVYEKESGYNELVVYKIKWE